jgi:solute carrier family 25 phosphate transporter 23/24/25/41
LSPEGDAEISSEILEGIGTILHFLRPFFGAIISIAQPLPRHTQHDADYYDNTFPLDDSFQNTVPPPQSSFNKGFDSPNEQLSDTDWTQPPTSMPVLIAISPQIGYFLAGGAAGMISRTTTAPLDRLKVYLIAQTGTNTDTLRLAKSGAPLQALRGAMRSTSNAIGELWAAGGIRSLFAG